MRSLYIKIIAEYQRSIGVTVPSVSLADDDAVRKHVAVIPLTMAERHSLVQPKKRARRYPCMSDSILRIGSFGARRNEKGSGRRGAGMA